MIRNIALSIKYKVIVIICLLKGYSSNFLPNNCVIDHSSWPL